MFNKDEKTIGINSPSVIIPEFRDENNKKRLKPKRGSFVKVQSKISSYILNDCNSYKPIFHKKDININIDNTKSELLISGKGQGNICLNTVSKSAIQGIINDEGLPLTAKIRENLNI